MRSLHAHPGAGPVRRLPLYVRVAWILLLVLGLFPLLAACLDLMADLRDGIPADHQAAFARVAGLPWSSAEQSLPG